MVKATRDMPNVGAFTYGGVYKNSWNGRRDLAGYYTNVPDILEKLVRPSQSGDVRPDWRKNIKSASGTDKNALVDISWGGSGESIFSLQYPPPNGPKLDWPDDKNKETERTYDVVRVKNKDDPDQYIDTEVMTDWRGRNMQTGAMFNMQFGQTQASENIEIISRGNRRRG